jgi:hypothetical protein
LATPTTSTNRKAVEAVRDLHPVLAAIARM